MIPTDIRPEQLAKLQITCPTLEKIRVHAVEGNIITMKDHSEYKLIVENKLIFRLCINSPAKQNIGLKTLVVSIECRNKILSVAHEALDAGHFSTGKPSRRFFLNFIGQEQQQISGITTISVTSVRGSIYTYILHYEE